MNFTSRFPQNNHTLSLKTVIDLIEARPLSEEDGMLPVKYNLSLAPGECALIECRDAQQTSFFTDLCLGLIPLSEGKIRCLGLEWAKLEEKRVCALRGRINRMSQNSGWMELYGTHMNILWASLHHTKTPLEKLVEQATLLSRDFGLPSLPTQLPTQLSAIDLKRAEYVRLFMGNPSLLLLENPIQSYPRNLYTTFLAKLTQARQKGCAIIWISSDRTFWHEYKDDTMQYFRLSDAGLLSMRSL